jgi:hypothetical protein
MRKVATVFVLATLLCGGILLGQSSNATITGFVQDASQAIVPGVTVTATNTQTGITASTVSNESGSYTIQSLLPGTYRLSATLPGFRTHNINDVALGAGITARYNFKLEVGQVSSTVEVTANASNLITESSSSIGQVLDQSQVQDLPLVSNNVLDLMKVMAGVRGDGLGEGTTFAGITTGMVNTSRDGLSVQEGRYAAGVGSTTLMNPDMVGEFRVILSPVDAELGRGNGQVQILTRSGTNALHGAAVWSVRNSALDANTWSNNRQVVNGVWKPTQPTWINRHQATVSAGGPILRNKTFFFALYDQQFERQRQTARATVLTDCARNGIFRYWEGWGNGNFLTNINTGAAAPARPSVDSSGNPVRPPTNPNGTPYTGQLRFFSVFGAVTNTPTKPDCSDAQISGTPFDTRRTQQDPSGVTQKYLDAMPHANVFDSGDGLNTAIHQWLRGGHNSAAFGLANGTDNNTDRKQINVKIDHNFNASHKIAANYSYEWIIGDYLGGGAGNAWPGYHASQVIRRPRVFTLNGTSTIFGNMLNEARFGYRANKHVIWAPWEVTDPSKAEVPLSLLLQGGQGFPIAYAPAAVGAMSTNNYVCMTNCAQQGNRTPLFDYADTFSWTKGKHAFKVGADYRYAYTSGSETPTAPIPRATGGAGQNPNQSFNNNPLLPGLVSANQTTANSLLYFQAGSVNQVFQYYFLQESKDLEWENYMTVPGHRKITEPHQNDWDIFFKDDWKVTPSLTLNLGLRYEYYGVPYEGNGLTVAPVGGGHALFGISGRSFDQWLRPPTTAPDLNLLTAVEFVGPKTVNEGRSIYDKDWNNFGPAIGFSWVVPWFGDKPTSIRGGYQITYAGAGRLGNYSNYLFSNPGFLNQPISTGPLDGSYFSTQNLPSLIPLTPTADPMRPVPLLKTGPAIYAYEKDFKTPYIQNFTLSANRDLTRKINLDLRYVGTKAVGLIGTVNINSPNVFYNPALFDAFERTRRGENVELFDQIFMGLALTGNTPVNGTTQRGSEHMRLNTTFRDNLANGNYVALANSLNTYNGQAPFAVAATTTGENGTVLRRANRGFNVPGGTTTTNGVVVPAGLFPENWIVANPQFGNNRYWMNSGSSNYHSLQVQATLRPLHGLSLQSTYVWSKALEVAGINGLGGGLTSGDPVYTNPADRAADYALAGNHVTHDFRSFGTFELPIGPDKLLLGNTSGLLARALERWQASFIVNASTGRPASIAAANMLYGNGVADNVSGLSLRGGSVRWGDPGPSGTLVGGYFESGALGKTADPQCATVATSLRNFCTLQAVTDTRTGAILFQNPKPGTRGNVGRQTMSLPGDWSFDAAMSKVLRVTESKSFQIRLDATNILNHPGVGSPSLDINSLNAFGLINAKDGSKREFRGSLRLSF